MGYRDISQDIAAVSQGYANHKLPPWLLRVQELLQQIMLILQQFLNSLFQHRDTGSTDSRSLSAIIQYAAYIAGALALAAIIYFVWRRASKRQELAASTTRGAAAVEKILDANGYRIEGKRLAEAADYRGACRALYLCFLQQMHEQKIAPFAPAKTNYEYRYVLSSVPLLQKDFVGLSEIVEEIWFGNKQAAPDDYANCQALLAKAGLELKRLENEHQRLKAESEA